MHTSCGSRATRHIVMAITEVSMLWGDLRFFANGWKQNHSCVTHISNADISMSTPPEKLI